MSQRDRSAIVSEDAPRPWFAVLATVACLAAGLFIVARTASLYPSLPEKIPTHFGISGEPDAWSRKSFASVYGLPLMALIMGPMLAGFAAAIAWLAGSPHSRDPRIAFGARSARDLAWFMGGLGLLVSGLQSGLAWGALEVARGARASIPSWALAVGLGMMIYCLGGAVVLILRVKNAPAPPEPAGTPTAWRAGIVYSNPADPAFIVPKRFGYGWTLNFGHPAARSLGWAFVLVFLLLMALAGIAIVGAS